MKFTFYNLLAVLDYIDKHEHVLSHELLEKTGIDSFIGFNLMQMNAISGEYEEFWKNNEKRVGKFYSLTKKGKEMLDILKAKEIELYATESEKSENFDKSDEGKLFKSILQDSGLKCEGISLAVKLHVDYSDLLALVENVTNFKNYIKDFRDNNRYLTEKEAFKKATEIILDRLYKVKTEGIL